MIRMGTNSGSHKICRENKNKKSVLLCWLLINAWVQMLRIRYAEQIKTKKRISMEDLYIVNATRACEE